MPKARSRNNSKARSNLDQMNLFEVTPLMEAVAMKAPVKSKIKKDFAPEQAEKILKTLKQQNAPTVTVDEETNEKRRKRIVRIKRIAKEMEQGNKSKIIVFPSYSRKNDRLEWYKMGDFSALYYAYRMATRMGRSAKVLKDTDRFARMHAIVSIKNIEKFLEEAMRLNEIDGYEMTLDGFYILNLKQSLTDDEVGVLRNMEKTRIDMMHNVLKPRKADAAVYQAILMLDRQILPRANHLEGGYKTTTGANLVNTMCEITRVYFDFADGVMEVETMKRLMLQLINKLKSVIVLLGEVNVIGYDVATSIGENIVKLKELVEGLK